MMILFLNQGSLKYRHVQRLNETRYILYTCAIYSNVTGFGCRIMQQSWTVGCTKWHFCDSKLTNIH